MNTKLPGKAMLSIFVVVLLAPTVIANFSRNPRLVLGALAAVTIMVLIGLLMRFHTARSEDGPMLSSHEMLGANGLQAMSQGTIAGFPYSLLTNDSGRVMFFVTLDHNSWSHIIAYGDKSRLNGMTKGLIVTKWLEPASLEGDFPKYFHMYCNPEAQETLREIFAPDVMAQFADFCRAYDFELFRDALYVSRAQDAADSADHTTLTTDVTDFLQENAEVLRRL